MPDKFSSHCAAAHGQACCRLCHKLNTQTNTYCRRCHTKLELRIGNSVQKTMALVISAIIFYFPANLLPIMETNVLGSKVRSSILSGVWLFFDQGAYFVASVIFIASIVIPVAKMSALLWLCYQASYGQPGDAAQLTKLYQFTEFIGKWSMIDIFVVAILVALIQAGNLMSITPGLASASFTVVVILTMLAALNFDTRLLWDRVDKK